mgnify:CR=1 FL=1
MNKCINVGCKVKSCADNDYCKKHQDDYYFKLARDKKLKRCKNYRKGCKHLLKIENIHCWNLNEECDNCIKERAKNKCVFELCESKKSLENDYCKKHQIIYYEKMLETEGKKICGNFKKGCMNTIIHYNPAKKCQDCLKKDYENKKNKIRRKRPSNITDVDEIKQFCKNQNIDNYKNEEIVFCNKCFNGFPKYYYMIKGIEQINCSICRSRFVKHF